MLTIEEEWKDFRSYLRDNIAYIFTVAIVVMAVYGIRAFRDGFCIDSEIMISQPDYMKNIWLGSNRFGMYAINEIFGLQRLSPYLSGFLMMLTLWMAAVLLSYTCWIWSGKTKKYRSFTRLFPLLAVTSPLFAEQYLFILQAFEISMGLLLVIVSVYCTDRVVRMLCGIRDMQGDERISVSLEAGFTDENGENRDLLKNLDENSHYAKMAKHSHFLALWGGYFLSLTPQQCAHFCLPD